MESDLHPIRRTMRAHADSWITNRPPPRTGSFYVSVRDPEDGRNYTTIAIWQDGRWDMLYGKIIGWQEKPAPITWLVDYNHEIRPLTSSD